jgi:hypothetical protein
MPPLNQRRNHAYLNRLDYREQAASRCIGDCLAATLTGLAIYLGGSVDCCLRPAELSA